MTGADQTDAVEALADRVISALSPVYRAIDGVRDAYETLLTSATSHGQIDTIEALVAAEVARRVDEHLAEVDRRIRNARPRVFGPLDAARIVRDYREEVRHG